MRARHPTNLELISGVEEQGVGILFLQFHDLGLDASIAADTCSAGRTDTPRVSEGLQKSDPVRVLQAIARLGFCSSRRNAHECR